MVEFPLVIEEFAVVLELALDVDLDVLDEVATSLVVTEGDDLRLFRSIGTVLLLEGSVIFSCSGVESSETVSVSTASFFFLTLANLVCVRKVFLTCPSELFLSNRK